MNNNLLINLPSGVRHPVSVIILFLGVFVLWDSAVAEQSTQIENNQTVWSGAADELTHPLLYPVIFFRKYISPVDGHRCPMYPSCSQYCLEAVQKHGLLMGWIMASDRLIRCGRNELKLSPTVLVNDVRRSYDPLTNNDFWW
jgi:putative membrane protein insertion efficiency factor